MKKLCLLAVCSWMATACAAETLTHGRFQDLTIYRPRGEVQRVVLFLSGGDGWNAHLASAAQALAGEGALVAGIDTPALFADLERDDASCLSPDGDLENLSHFVQAYYRLPTYHAPILIGYSAGATFAYAMVAQAPPGTFAGGISLAFHPHLTLRKSLCESGSLRFTASKDHRGATLLPAPRLHTPWIVLQGREDAVYDVATAQDFVSRTHHSDLVVLSGVGPQYAETFHWLTPLRASVQKLAAQRVPVLLPPKELLGLPIVEVAAKASSTDVLAVLLSGDGGWAGIDKKVAATLAQRGIPVVGLDSLRYFWSERTPQSTATDVDRILSYYSSKWSKRRVLLIGYSQGADVLPFVINRLRPQTRAQVQLVALLGPGHNAEFEFHLSDWLGSAERGLPIRPEIERISGPRVLCIYGAAEADALCPTLPKNHVQILKLSGGHHFDGDYQHLATLLIERVTVP